MRTLRRTLPAALALSVCLAAAAPMARAAPPAAGRQAGQAVQAAKPKPRRQSSVVCEVAGPVIEGLVPAIANLVGAGESVCEAAGSLAGKAVSAVGNAALDAVASWMIGAARQITGFVVQEMQRSSTPQLRSAWFTAQLTPMVDLGAALALLVTLIALACAAIRRDPQALAGILAGIVRAGLGTGVLVALTVLALEVADDVSGAVLASSPRAFWSTLAHAWGTSGFGGFGSSALAMLIALIETVAALDVWLELIVRDAAIYIAVLFFPAVLAASIWPPLAAWTGRLARLLLLFVILKPVALIVLSLAGSAAAAGLSLQSGFAGSVGTILTAIVIFALTSFMPWAIMYLLAADAESAYLAAGLRSAVGSAVAGQGGRSLSTAGGLRNLRSRIAARGGGQGGGDPASGGGAGSGSGGAPSGGAPGGGFGRASSNGSGTAGQDSVSSSPLAVPASLSPSLSDLAGAAPQSGPDGGSAAAGGGAPAGGEAGGQASPAAAGTVGTGSIGAAAGVNTSGRVTTPRTAGGASQVSPASPSPSPGEDSGGARTTERKPLPPRPARPPQPAPGTPMPSGGSLPRGGSRTPVPARGQGHRSPSRTGGERHLRVVREDPQETPDSTGPETA